MSKAGKRFIALMLVMFLLLPEPVLAGLAAGPDNRAGTVRVPARKSFTRGDKLPGDLPEDAYRKDEVIIRFKPGYKKVSAFAGKNKLEIVKSDHKLGYFLAKTPQHTDLTKLFTTLSKDPDVLYIQPNLIYRPFKTFNDAQYSRQWAIKKINLEKAWDITAGKPGIVVAVLDTGVDNKHPDLQGRLVPGTNTVNPLRSTRDDVGHGTHVAGIIAATADNGIGVAGMANVRVMPVKVFGNSQEGSDTSISDGIIWAADHGAKVINMSFGSFFRSPLLNDAIEYARDKGVVMVAAAGNWASEYISYPAALKDVISVAATNNKDELSEFSSFGPEIDVSAPGEDIYSTFWDPYKGSSYREESGTSMASPMVAGLAALLLSRNPKLSAEGVRQQIEASATDLGEPGWDPRFGHGRIDVYRALTTSFAHTDSGNNTQDKAMPLNQGQTVTGKIDYGSDVDWYRINLPVKGALQVAAEPAGLVSPAVEIYDEAGTMLASFNSTDNQTEEPDFGFFSAQSSPVPGFQSFKGSSAMVAETVYGLAPDLEQGKYFIKVFGNHNRWSKENYRLTAAVFPEQEMVRDAHEPNESPEEARQITLSQPVQGAIIGQEDLDLYQVNLDADRYYRLELDVPPGLDLAVEVEQKEESVSRSEDEYYRDYFYESIDNAGQGEKETGVFKTAKKGSGTYYIMVYDKSGGSVNAYYNLRLAGFTPQSDQNENNNTWEQATPVKVTDKVYASFRDEEDEDWYQIDIAAKGILEVGVEGFTDSFPEMMLLQDPEKEPVAYFDPWYNVDNGDAGALSWVIKVNPGTYYLAARRGYGPVSYNEYGLKFQFRTFNFVDNEDNDTPLKANNLTLNVPQQGTLYPDGDIDFYVLDVEKPEPILVYLSSPKDMNPSVRVFKEMEPDEDKNVKDKRGQKEKTPGPGESGQENEGPPEPDLEPVADINNGAEGKPDIGVFVPGKPGRYYIAVYTWQPAARGVYTLSLKPYKFQPDKWEDNNTLPKAKALNRAAAVQPTFMGTEDVDWFKVYIPAATRLNVTMKVPGDIDGVIEIYDSAAKPVGKIDHALEGEEETGGIKIDRGGWYYIKAYDFLGNSSVQTYSLTVNWGGQAPPAKQSGKR